MASYTSPIRREVRGDRHHQIQLLQQAYDELSMSPRSKLYRRNLCRNLDTGGSQPHARQRQKRGLSECEDVTVQIATWQNFHLSIHGQGRTSGGDNQHMATGNVRIKARGPGQHNNLQVRSTPAV
jgi:hypothetical protein